VSRAVPIWIGKTDDTPAPPRVRARVFVACDGKCHRCGRKICTGERWTLEHLIALINGGANAEHNLGVTCDWCLPQKNAEDVAIKAKSARVRLKHIGVHTPKGRLQSRGFPPRPKQHTASRPIRPKPSRKPEEIASE
jgi:5-methylcytosine-specific restriction protein A